jgi:PAS domain S-box-containing protein
MREEELRKLVASTSDPAFVVNGDGVVVAWNEAAAKFFGITAERAIGETCSSIVQGMDECGAVCSENCMVRQAIDKSHPLGNFDLEVQTVDGERWCNVSVLTAEANESTGKFAILIVRAVDLGKRLEMVVRDFVVTSTDLTAEQAVAMIASHTAARESHLSAREIEILRFLAKGSTTKSVADRLHIGRTTVNNHVQHILRKLDAHTRLEAIRRAERAGLI